MYWIFESRTKSKPFQISLTSWITVKHRTSMISGGIGQNWWDLENSMHSEWVLLTKGSSLGAKCGKHNSSTFPGTALQHSTGAAPLVWIMSWATKWPKDIVIWDNTLSGISNSVWTLVRTDRGEGNVEPVKPPRGFCHPKTQNLTFQTNYSIIIPYFIMV